MRDGSASRRSLRELIVVALVAPWIERIRDRPLTAALLDGVNAAAIGLMASVTLQLGVTAIRDPLTVGICAAAGLALLSGRVPSVALVLAGAAAGLAAAPAGIGP